MVRALPVVGGVFLIAAAVVAQQPLVQNGKIAPRSVTALERDVLALGAASTTEPVWVGWRVPMIAGDRDHCSYWNNVRGDVLESGITGSIHTSDARQLTPPPGPVALEGGTGLIVLMRFVEGAAERLRTLADDCPIDAGGRTINWLDNVSTADSVRLLDQLTTPSSSPASLKILTQRESVASSAIGAIALHRDAAADAVLERIVNDRDHPLRSRALTRLGSSRGARGLATLRQLLGVETTPEGRRQIVNAIGLSREPGAVDVLRGLLQDADAKLRAEVVTRFAAAGGPAVSRDVLAIIEKDASPDVRRRATHALAAWRGGEGIPALLQLARSTADPAVRKEAVAALSRSSDPRALAYMEELIKR